MSNVRPTSGKCKKRKRMGEPRIIRRQEYADLDLDSRLEMIRSLIPLGLLAIHEELEQEVQRLSGMYYSRKLLDQRNYRHGANRGSVRLAGQRVPIHVPRVRGPQGEIRLGSYERLQGHGELDEELFRRVFYGISCRNYERAAEAIPGAIGLSRSTVSRHFIEASTAQLRQFQERELSDLDLVVLFLDGKTFAEDEMVIALGVTLDGEKKLLGFVQTATENSRVLSEFLRSLTERGLDLSSGLLVVIDGSKGLRSAVRRTWRKHALIQRCQWHKRENVVSYLPKSEQAYWRRRLQQAYERPTLAEAKRALKKIRDELSEINLSAARSLDEGLDETLTLHRLGVFPLLGRSLKTTNCLESINAMAEERCGKVDCWKNSKQKHRWLAASLLDIEPRLRRLCGYLHLPRLREALMRELKIGSSKKVA